MIQGLQIQLSSKELKEQLQERAKFHSEKSTFYQQQCKDFAAASEKLPEEMQNTSNSPIRTMEDKVRDHQNRSSIFSFMAEHIVPDETYQLTENDLTRLEIIARYF